MRLRFLTALLFLGAAAGLSHAAPPPVVTPKPAPIVRPVVVPAVTAANTAAMNANTAARNAALAAQSAARVTQSARPVTTSDGQFAATKEPVSPSGVKSVVDLPPGQHMRNSGGNDRTKDNPRGEPGKGYGLCVFTSLEIMSRWLNVLEIAGLQKWMESKPGGGYPQKVDAVLKAFCESKGVAVPPYVQHTGGDDSFLDLAVATGRGACVTYAGYDGFYRNAFGQDVWIDHMVYLAHLDSEGAAIIDNNRPGVWVWMSRKDFLARWRARGGGWAVVFLASPPPPHLTQQQLRYGGCGCGCGDDCTCDPGACPQKCPVLVGQNCPNGRCPLPRPATIPANPPLLYAPGDSVPAPIGTPPSDRHEWGMFDDGKWGWRFKREPAAAVQPVVGENYGVVRDMIHQRPTFSINGVESTEAEARAAVAGALVNDADRWHLTAVGDPAFVSRVRADLGSAPAAGKLHVQGYGTDSWAVRLFDLPSGVSLRKPATARRAEQVGTLAAADYSAGKLSDLLDLMNGPKPVKPKEPNVQPSPTPANPAAPNNTGNWVLMAVVAAVLFLIFRK